jgi:hypothetical protein
MPAGLQRFPSALARDPFIFPHLRTGDVTLVSTTDENLLQRLNCCKGGGVLTDPASLSSLRRSRGLKQEGAANFA